MVRDSAANDYVFTNNVKDLNLLYNEITSIHVSPPIEVTIPNHILLRHGWYNNMFGMPQATVDNLFSNDVSTFDSTNNLDLHEFPDEKLMRFEGPLESAGLSNYTYGFGEVALPSHVPKQGV